MESENSHNPSPVTKQAPGVPRWCLPAVLGIHVCLLAYSAAIHAPTWDEVGHLAGGLAIWKFGRFDIYRVNPPLVRSIAAIPVALAGPAVPWERYMAGPGARSEFAVGPDFIYAHGKDACRYFTWARWACLPLSVLGGWICFAWSRELYGPKSGLAAATMWSFSPNIMAHAQLITPDAGAAALGVLAAYAFWRWVRARSWSTAVIAGAALGLALLTKFTWLIALPLWPLIWVMSAAKRAIVNRNTTAVMQECQQLCVLLAISLGVVNAGYAFDGSGRPLGDYPFVSQSLTRLLSRDEFGHRSSRFSDTVFADLPVPLPREFPLGIDQQKTDFETRMDSFLRGEWKTGGWWYYYMYALLIKEPVGLWALALLAAFGRRPGRSSFGDEAVLLAPGIVLLAFVSSQTGFNHHLRYVLPAMPFLFIWCGRLFSDAQPRLGFTRVIGGLALIGFGASSLAAYPHQLSYFSEAIGGPTNGWRHLSNSNTDWGQDMLAAAEWAERNPQARPLFVATANAYPLDAFGAVYTDPPLDSRMGFPIEPSMQHVVESGRSGPLPGWYLVSVNHLHVADGRYRYLLDFKPRDRLGFSLWIYEISREDVERWRTTRGAERSKEHHHDHGK